MVDSRAFLVALLAVRSSYAVEDFLVKHSFTADEADTHGARALDGSPYAWYQSPKGESIKDWIIYLEGGGECETHEDCLNRSKTDLGTSTMLPRSVDRNADVSDGMTSSDRAENPRFADFGVLYLPYLSGDDWLGTMRVPCVPWGGNQTCKSPVGGGPGALFFAGALIFDATVKRWRSSLNGPPRRVLLSGGSAGGQGAFFLADRLRSLLNDAETIVKVNPQYGWFAPQTDTYPDWKKGRHTDPSVPYPSSASPYDVPAWCYNISLALPERCLEAARKRGVDPLRCTNLPTVAMTVGIPLFISTNVFDGWLTADMQYVPEDDKIRNGTDDRLTYLVSITAPAQRESVRLAVAAASAPGDRAAFVPACTGHPMYWSGQDAPRLGSRSCTHADAVATWFFEDTGPDACEAVLIDERSNFDELASMKCNEDLIGRETTIQMV
eukprot:TRINITY_DN58938_c0_g1_i1.p1 TRINITY_DN58938_c0_g1~~TRINITY_DN58938_c0_g1_i1.p1  ORF type:complete len:457 (+),score=61.03 TRINITY_DN58938_c0_g1_i1:57-1373(+)